MKRNSFILSLMCLFAFISASKTAMGQYATVTSDWIETNGKASNGEKALVIHYSLNVVGCYGHTITALVDFHNEEGVYLFNKNNNRLTASNNHEIHYDDSNVNDRTFVIPYSKFNIPSGRQTYYYQITITDKVTGAYLGNSDYSNFDLVGSSSSSSSSNTQKASSSQSASFSDLRFVGGKNSKGEDAFLFYYDVTLKGCNKRKVKIQLTFKDSNGNYLYGKDNKKLIWNQTIDVKSDNVKYTDQSFALTLKQLNATSEAKNYNYQFAAYDDKTGDFLGQSQKFEQYIGNAVVFKNQRLALNDIEDGKPAINYYCYINYILPEAHDLKLVCAVETDKSGRRHHFADGSEMINEYYYKNENKWVSGYLDLRMGFDHDEINPLPGKHTYYVRIYVYDGNTGKYLGESGALSFDAEDASNRNSSSNSRSTQQTSSSTKSTESSNKAVNNQSSSSKPTSSSNQNTSKGKDVKIKMK